MVSQLFICSILNVFGPQKTYNQKQAITSKTHKWGTDQTQRFLASSQDESQIFSDFWLLLIPLHPVDLISQRETLHVQIDIKFSNLSGVYLVYEFLASVTNHKYCSDITQYKSDSFRGGRFDHLTTQRTNHHSSS